MFAQYCINHLLVLWFEAIIHNHGCWHSLTFVLSLFFALSYEWCSVMDANMQNRIPKLRDVNI